MNKQEVEQIKERIKISRDRLMTMFVDIDCVSPKMIEDFKLYLTMLEADLIAYGGYLEKECTKEMTGKAYLEVLNKQADDIGKGAEVRDESFKLQKRNAEIQEELIKSHNESIKRQIERDEYDKKTDTRMITAMESIAYSLAKISVGLENKSNVYKPAEDCVVEPARKHSDSWKYEVEC